MATTHVDWFGFRSKTGPEAMAAAMAEAVPQNLGVELSERKSGWRSFERSFDVWFVSKEGNPDTDRCRVGMAMSGGEAVKGWSLFSLTGEGCGWVGDWSRTMDVCTDRLDGFELKRVDVALDRFDGSHWHEVDAAWAAGEFSPAGGGKKPKAKPIDSRRAEDGRTYYVGSRESAKFYRGYEKGMQLLGPQMVAAQDRDPEGFEVVDWLTRQDVHFKRDENGRPSGIQLVTMRDWWRDEVEFKPVDNPLPLDIVEQRDQYFAGAYPYLAKVLPTADAQPLITRRERMPQLELAKALATIRHQYGNTLFTALVAHHGDIGAVWSKIVGRKHNDAMVAAGVLMVDHD